MIKGQTRDSGADRILYGIRAVKFATDADFDNGYVQICLKKKVEHDESKHLKILWSVVRVFFL